MKNSNNQNGKEDLIKSRNTGIKIVRTVNSAVHYLSLFSVESSVLKCTKLVMSCVGLSPYGGTVAARFSKRKLRTEYLVIKLE